MYSSTFVRYERRGDRVVPVRVTKAWVTFAAREEETRKFITTRVSELRRMPRNEPDRDDPPTPAWESSHRVETRERLMTLLAKDAPEGECLVREAGYDQCWLPYSVPASPTAAQAGWTLENGNGWLLPRGEVA